MKNKFIIISPFYNVANTISKTVNSVKKQNYKNYEAYFIDDLSSDDSAKIVSDMISECSNIHLIKNKVKKYSLKNIYDTIYAFSNDNDIIIILDGDDFLFGKDVLQKLNNCYNKNDCWLTYGSYINLSDKQVGKFSSQIPQQVIDNNSYRDYKWCTSHLRSFKSFLFKNIIDSDLKDKDNNFYTITGDLAIMFPMLEMSGEKSFYVKDILYIWNDLNNLNDHKKNNILQLKIENILRGSKKYEKFVR
tara:strand:+ start:3348 stop:4088 length:741 start_codon:yes stop_codon:yes gene_type:complete